ncbi:MAG: hypothetical protein KA226_09030 [Gemmatimonadales bacterium]|nr:hypothetical protein [Gemmatimonadales bacterium]
MNRLAAAFLQALLVAPLTVVAAQSSSTPPATTKRDSVAEDNTDNAFAVLWSGTWKLDGEYKNANGVYSKLTGYFAYVASTRTSADDGDRAVIAMFLEPMAGGDTSWLGASLYCAYAVSSKTVNCAATSGAASLLDINIIFTTIPRRGQSVEAQITEPTDKSSANRFTSRSSNRGKFTMKPIGT